MISKLPDVGTTIFTVMSRRARELGALNLGQGFPDYDIDPRLTELVTEAMRAGFNQYAPMEGAVSLREAIATKLRCTTASSAIRTARSPSRWGRRRPSTRRFRQRSARAMR